jgi:hypothetical protein
MSLLAQKHAQVVQGIGVIRFLYEGRTIDLLCLVNPAGTLQGDGLLNAFAYGWGGRFLYLYRHNKRSHFSFFASVADASRK